MDAAAGDAHVVGARDPVVGAGDRDADALPGVAVIAHRARVAVIARNPDERRVHAPVELAEIGRAGVPVVAADGGAEDAEVGQRHRRAGEGGDEEQSRAQLHLLRVSIAAPVCLSPPSHASQDAECLARCRRRSRGDRGFAF